MKKLLIVIITVLINICLLWPVNWAHAVDLPYVVAGSDVWLLNSETGSRIFMLPQTYYAKIDNMDVNYYYITFNGVSGKVNKGSVSAVGYHAVASGTIQDLTIAEKYKVFTEIKLRSSIDGAGVDIAVPTSESLIFLGKYPADEMWYYVKYNEVCGYVRAEFTSAPEIQFAPFAPESKQSENTEKPPEPDTETPDTENDLTKILIISGLGVALIALIILIFRPGKGKKNRYYYEE